MNTPMLVTERIILRKFEERDLEALYKIFSDSEVNRFLPWFPLKSMGEAQVFYEERFGGRYSQKDAYDYAICLKENDYPVGYLDVGMDESHDLGYGLRKEFWHKGFATEAGRAVVEQLRKDRIPYITATHDINNPESGNVMRRLGMKYQYSYEEQWQPKDFPVLFRMYQLNLDGNVGRVYRKYWENATARFVETDI